VDVNTKGKIIEIVEKPIAPELVMFLINAIYFKGNWTVPFDTGMVWDWPFYYPDGSHEMKPLMGTDTLFNYANNDLFQAIDIPYGDKKFCMTVFLPKPEHTVDDLISQLNDETYAAWLAEMVEVDVELWLPKFKFKYRKKLDDILTAMGMGIAFDQFGANFLDMVDPNTSMIGNLYIDFVIHKTFVQVDETGTEAAAVTAVGMGVTSIDPDYNLMRINRPFIFVIRELETGSILFMGKIVDPVWE
jgi:serpin B